MFAKLFSLIRENPGVSLAILAGVLILGSVFLAPAWWGERAQGALIGIACTLVLVFIYLFVADDLNWDTEKGIPWVLLIVPTVIAVLLRKVGSIPVIRFQIVRFYVPTSPQMVMLFLDGLMLFVFLMALIRSLSRGDSVSVESHWGGLGGGIAGWRFSAPLIYLLAIAFLLAITSAVAWRIFPPPVAASQPAQQQQQQQQVHPAGGSSTSPPAAH